MFDVIKKLLFARQLSFDDGEIKLLGQNIVMIPVTIFMEFYKNLKINEPKKYGNILYNIAEEVGRKYSVSLKENYKMSSTKLIEWDLNTLSMAGLGKGKIMKLDIKKKIAIINVEIITTFFFSNLSLKIPPTCIPIKFPIPAIIKNIPTVKDHTSQLFTSLLDKT